MLVAIVSWSGCISSDSYEKNIAIPSLQWQAKYTPTYRFQISDTTDSYSLFLLLRHTDNYPFANIWLHVFLKEPGNTNATKQVIEVPLAQADGKWLARKFHEIIEHKMPLHANGSPIHFTKTGTYEISIEQIMRVNPLPEIMSVGIRLEKNK